MQTEIEAKFTDVDPASVRVRDEGEKNHVQLQTSE